MFVGRFVCAFVGVLVSEFVRPQAAMADRRPAGVLQAGGITRAWRLAKVAPYEHIF